ncbi:hypothetical protein KIW84_060110 [Lathyrus oleraceus]|uniref:Uncharacterized protein n=1 Tax=Pisum sativum TaxID=3888 RepID=A0A9D4W0H0_PEA|nr:hypothetical protein KIW84_060110 [Pisum sativum]
MGGHNGIHLTFGRLQGHISWEGMRNNVITFIRNCVICQQMKPANRAPYGLLQPLPIPDKVWEYISLDFITCLHSFPNHIVFMVVVDRLSKASHFEGRHVHELSKIFYGHFKIIKVVGEVAFQLELPATSKIHPVFHASQLKLCIGVITSALELPPEAVKRQPPIQPLIVLD